MMKNGLLIFCFFLTINTLGQDLSKYNYVIVPEKFSFLNEADQFQLNSLTKFLFEKFGFETYMEGEEVNLKTARCEGLYADVLNGSGMFRTRLSVVLKDCDNRQIFVSREGVSREKDYKVAYQESLRQAFESMKTLANSPKEVIVSGTSDLNIKSEAKKDLNDGMTSAEIKTGKDFRETSEDPRNLNNTMSNSNLSTPENSKGINFSKDGKSYFIQENKNGFDLLHQGTTEPFATLIRSSVGNSFIYNSMTSKGIACMDTVGNLIIEILKEDGNSLETIVYRIQDQ